jgi:hypothetical protein
VSRASLSQRTRTQDNPLVLGDFSSLALRYLQGRLGPLNQVVGRADTSQNSNGGFGGGTYNHWFRINITSPAWIIITKGGPRPNYIQTSFYDLNQNPIQGRGVFQEDSITQDEVYFPYLDHAVAAGSDLYNTYSRMRLDRGNDMYYTLPAGAYLLCVSSTRNELIDYAVGVIVEFPISNLFWELEDGDGSVCLQETDINAIEITSPISVNTTIPTDINGFTLLSAQINFGATLTVSDGSTWYIGERIPAIDYDNFKIILEPVNDDYYTTIHDHSLSEWRNAWQAEHQESDRFPDLFVPLTNRP